VQRNVDKCWAANEENLVLNFSKTKYILSSTKLSSYRELNNIDIDLRVGSISLERVSSAKPLGTDIFYGRISPTEKTELDWDR